MSFTWMIVAAISGLAAWWLHKHTRQQHARQQQTEALGGIILIGQLIGYWQELRWFQSQAGKAPRSINLLLGKLEELFDMLDAQPLVSQQDRWRSCLDHWQRLRLYAIDSDGQNRVQQCTHMVFNLQQLIEDIAIRANLNKQALAGFANVTLMWREIPLLIEYLWQASTLTRMPSPSTQVASQLDKQVRRLTRTIFHHVRYNGPANPHKERLVQLANQSCKAASTTFQQWSVDPEQATMSDDSPLAESAIDHTMALYRFELNQLAETLQTPRFQGLNQTTAPSAS
ncbi:hypothetical protein LJ739_17835 [Aestuariibacter halophilus]|uniref:Nitrate/nitrite sensing protein domain-containing protein n=1 Tax=Fluctibacter halophilus TaxID=226011 RepID=A0ABS8GG15_9ALTE|nr:hypothetical protein [Aestuariibacter halophilus]MCC2618121.1 hypothetical protein [Aestuariibacter halophilus]